MQKKLESTFTYCGYKCTIISIEDNDELSLFYNIFPSKYYCGYVAVPYWHPAYEKKYDNLHIQCHGGLTYSDHNLLGQDYPAWWIGFDCAHFYDIDNPKDINFVRQECRNIVDQLRDMEN